ncbi:hypothetical protein FEM48_Zijuj01G0287300 [Ziziphus jujuba var. spinosa]|nr:hypothetical protein FEM48_Zijuj01G0287300 [Ziziphus jujuba var. spinosa]
MSKRKLLLDLDMMMKRGKIAGKALGNLMFHHHHHLFTASASARRSADHPNLSFASQREYEFSCSNTPSYPFSLSKRRNHSHNFFGCAHAPPTLDDEATTANALKAVLEILNNNDVVVEASPALPGFGKSPMVRQLRITDSPFPLRNVDDDDTHVDEAAEEFIKRFYKDLKLQRGE